MKSYIKKAYDKAVLILNNGHSYEFYSKFTLKCKPIEVYFGMTEEDRNYALDNNLKYMNEDDYKELWEWIDRDGMPFVTGGVDISHFFYEDPPGNCIRYINELREKIIEFEEAKKSEDKINKNKEDSKEIIKKIADLEIRIDNLEKKLLERSNNDDNVKN